MLIALRANLTCTWCSLSLRLSCSPGDTRHSQNCCVSTVCSQLSAAGKKTFVFILALAYSDNKQVYLMNDEIWTENNPHTLIQYLIFSGRNPNFFQTKGMWLLTGYSCAFYLDLQLSERFPAHHGTHTSSAATHNCYLCEPQHAAPWHVSVKRVPEIVTMAIQRASVSSLVMFAPLDKIPLLWRWHQNTHIRQEAGWRSFSPLMSSSTG